LLPDPPLFAGLFDFTIGFDFDPEALLVGFLTFSGLLGDFAAGFAAIFCGVLFLVGFFADSSSYSSY
jgi:hypothetical protein